MPWPSHDDVTSVDERGRVEAWLGLAHRAISTNELGMPQGNADAFTVLAEADVIDEPFADRLAAMARFRNRLVHIDWDVDDRQVHRYIREDVSDVGAFIDEPCLHRASAFSSLRPRRSWSLGPGKHT